MVTPEHTSRLRDMWVSVGKPAHWAAPLSVHQEYERALMGTVGKYQSLSLSHVLKRGVVVWMTIRSDMALPEGF